MNQTWYSLFLPTSESPPIADALRALLAAQGYAPYDPFPGGTGTPPNLRDMVRQFVAPAQAGWVGVLGQPVEALLPDLAQATGTPLIYGWLGEDGGGFAVFDGGARHDDPAALEPYLRSGASSDQLQRAWAGDLPVPVVDSGQPPVAVLGEGALPPEVQQFARQKGVDPKKASKMAERLTGSLFGKLARKADDDVHDDQAQAQALVMGSGRDIWNSLHGQRVRVLASVLALPANWRQPDWQTVRDAYQVHRLRQRSPRMPLMPGDKEALDAVPNALEYVPVYMGRT
jgi:hypothetical protein